MAKRRKTKRPTKLVATQRRLATAEWAMVKLREAFLKLEADALRLSGVWKTAEGTQRVDLLDVLASLERKLSTARVVQPTGALPALTAFVDLYLTVHAVAARLREVLAPTQAEVDGLPAIDLKASGPPQFPLGPVPGLSDAVRNIPAELLTPLAPLLTPEPPPHGDEHVPPWIRPPDPDLDAQLGAPCVRCNVRFDVHSMDAGHSYEAPPLVGAGELATEVQPPAKESQS